ncbi:ABC transporter substrate-binding protein [Altererythrobacter sp. KTW20L]|uniref:ABC transporter substrate-binding protein n=1 Tax=Altererythrobacter sp. KTW20L TaxID=2942210 RepID=UPI0020BEBF92|nr:ABC transporter substrate-binding protein [Altererythrobacter sp. KTW20L]MCL6249797.1 ABC transporter substrate-binding protein [Altererythrobacter sp. KTW20L]
MARRPFLPVLRSCFLAGCLGLAACSGSDGSFDVAFMDSEDNLFDTGVRLSESGQHVLAATRSGLVALNAQGEVVPALADRWNVTDGGSIFVFRLRDGTWPNGEELTAESVRTALNRAIRSLRGTSLGLDLAPVDEVRAMAGRVVEIRVASPMPDLLQLLAQPELGLVSGEGETGPMVLVRDENGAVLSMRPPRERGLPDEEEWQSRVRDIHLHALDAAEAIERFGDGEIEVVLGGDLASLPLADTGPLSRGTVRLDPVIGLFGLQVMRDSGLLATPELREAIALAIDRPALASAFNIGGWVPTSRLVAPGLSDDPGLVTERWTGLSMEERRNVAAARLAGAAPGEVPRLSVAIPDTPGHRLLFAELRSQLAQVGVGLVRAESAAEADLQLVDRIARYGSARWFLNQFNCQLDRGLCSEEADRMAGRALDERDTVRRALLLGEAEAALTSSNIYIPFGSPLRWALVRGNVEGFASNRWAFHPLPDMAVLPR